MKTKKLQFKGGFSAVLGTCYVWKCDSLKQHMNIKWRGKKESDLNINFLCPREEFFQFFLKFIFFNHFMGIFPHCATSNALHAKNVKYFYIF